MAKKNTGKAFEQLVQEIYQSFLDFESSQNGYRKIDVQHNVTIKGITGVEHQIDVFWQFELAGHSYSTLVEVKDWNTPVKLEQLRNFKSVMNDLPGNPNGIFVSRNGFQSGAQKYAEAHGISLIQLSESKDYLVGIRNVVTHYDTTALSIDEDWIDEDDSREEKVRLLVPMKDHFTTEVLNPIGEKVRLYDMMCADAFDYYFEEDNIRHTIEKALDGEWFWITENDHLPLAKICGYSFVCYNTSVCSSLKIEHENLASYVLSNLTNGQEHVYYPGSKRIEKKDCLHMYCY